MDIDLQRKTEQSDNRSRDSVYRTRGGSFTVSDTTSLHSTWKAVSNYPAKAQRKRNAAERRRNEAERLEAEADDLLAAYAAAGEVR